MDADTPLTRDELDRMTALVAPDWRVREATPVEAGLHPVAHLVVDAPDGERECYCKATPAGKEPTVDLEARLLALLDRETALPVPACYGVVDDHDDLRAPYAVLEAMPGEAHRRRDLPEIADETLESVAVETGNHLAELHGLDAVDAFGFLRPAGPTLRGERPSGDPGSIAVVDPTTDWRECVAGWADGTLSSLEATRFADVVPRAEPVLTSRIDALDGPFDPRLARIDHAIENVLLADGSLAAVLDWEFSLAATPAYDLVHVAWSLAGGPYLFAPDLPDRREAVRGALLAGYRERADGDVLDRFRANRACYELLVALRSMVHLETWTERFSLGAAVDDAAEALRADVAARLSAGG